MSSIGTRDRWREIEGGECERGAEKPWRNITSFYLGSSARASKLERWRQSEKERKREDRRGDEERWRKRVDGESERAKTLI